MASTTLIITNDFPPTIGGIEAFVGSVCDMLDHDVVVLTRQHPQARAHDRRLSFPVHRSGRVLLPTPAVARRAEELLQAHSASRVVYGAAAPLGLLAARLGRLGATHQLALSHGHETWWAQVPGARSALRRIGRDTTLAHISDFTGGVIGPALTPPDRRRMIRLGPPVDPDQFRPLPRLARPARPGRPTAVAAGRMIAQKGFDRLLEAWDILLADWPDHVPDRPATTLPELILAGDGPQRSRLQRRAAGISHPETVRFLGPVAHPDMPSVLAAAHVFVLPVRTRLAGLNPEGLGLVFLEAAASGLAVIAGRSGGAPETVVPGESGLVVDSNDPPALAAQLRSLLTDLPRAARMGDAGRRHVLAHHSVAHATAVLRTALALPG